MTSTDVQHDRLVSPDGKWKWDGDAWVPNVPSADKGTESAPPSAPSDAPSVVYVEKRGNGFAVAALVLGIPAIVIAGFPIVGLFGIVLAVIAVGLGIAGFVTARKRGKGLVMTIIAVLLAIAAVPIAIASTNSLVSSSKSTASTDPRVEQMADAWVEGAWKTMTPVGQAAQCATQPTHSGPYRAALFSVFVDTNITKGYDSDAVVDARTVAEQAMFDEVC
jgi:hypothetical protein